MTTVEVLQTNGIYYLCISDDRQVLLFWAFKRLVDVLNTAGALQVHIDNEHELELRQYKKI